MTRLSLRGERGPSWNRRRKTKTHLTALPAIPPPPRSLSKDRLINFPGSPSQSPRAASLCRRPRPATVQLPPAARALLQPRDGEEEEEEEGQLLDGITYKQRRSSSPVWGCRNRANGEITGRWVFFGRLQIYTNTGPAGFYKQVSGHSQSIILASKQTRSLGYIQGINTYI